VKKPGTLKDMIVIYIPSLKFITLEFDENIFEFKILCMHNFENNIKLK
jgi:hypothetical protein